MKDKRIRLYKISIDVIRTCKKVGKSSFEYKDKMFCVNIGNNYGGGIGFCETTLKKLSKRIEEEIW
jgi:hypothetical protein